MGLDITYQIAGAVYLTALIVLWTFAYRLPFPIRGTDRREELELVRRSVADRKLIRDEGLLSSALMMTLLPWLAVKTFRVSSETTVRIVPPFIYALMPTFTFLISGEYLDLQGSLIAAGFILSSFYFVYDPNIGRIGIALGFLSVSIWALLTGHTWLVVPSVSLLALSHYGTSLLFMFTMAICVVYGAAFDLTWLPDVSAAFGVSAFANLIWFGFYQTHALEIIRGFVVSCTQHKFIISRSELKGMIILNHHSFSRWVETYLSYGFGLTIAAGAAYSFYKNPFDLLSLFSLIGCAATCFTLFHRYATDYYGIVRVLFSFMPTLSPTLMILVSQLALYPIALGLLAALFLSTSGLLHYILGVSKRTGLFTDKLPTGG